jgi:hypothetical protein
MITDQLVSGPFHFKINVRADVLRATDNEMPTEAVSAGFYESPTGQSPKIQILTIEDLLSGKSKPQYCDTLGGSLNFKQAKTEEKLADQSKPEGF